MAGTSRGPLGGLTHRSNVGYFHAEAHGGIVMPQGNAFRMLFGKHTRTRVGGFVFCAWSM